MPKPPPSIASPARGLPRLSLVFQDLTRDHTSSPRKIFLPSLLQIIKAISQPTPQLGLNEQAGLMWLVAHGEGPPRWQGTVSWAPIQHAAWSLRLVPRELTHSACTPGCSHKKAIKGLLMGLELFSY